MDDAVIVLHWHPVRKRRDQVARGELGFRKHFLSENDSSATAGQINSDTRRVRRVAELAARMTSDPLAREPCRPSWIRREACAPRYVDQGVVGEGLRGGGINARQETWLAHGGHPVTP